VSHDVNIIALTTVSNITTNAPCGYIS